MYEAGQPCRQRPGPSEPWLCPPGCLARRPPDQKPPGAAQRKLPLACLSRLIFLYHRTPSGRPARLILWNTQLSSSTSVPVGGNAHQAPAVYPSGPWPCGGQLRGIFPFLSSRKRWKHRSWEQLWKFLASKEGLQPYPQSSGCTEGSPMLRSQVLGV